MRKFDSAQHIMARATRKHETTPILASSARIATRLHYLCPQLFPDPSFPSVQNDDDNVAAPNIKGSVCGISAENLLKVLLTPIFLITLLRLFKNVPWCMSDTSKLVHFGGSNTGAATFLMSPSNIDGNCLYS
ncbi:hypothetical protein R3W88_028202 [Solanum pinnatisectum]|uniref:Uncharacterized protein n=1 Tax=Solanum pinnatisectum TaxID=50273 RepID=A0AAV9LIX0_9SOLN|nr:hypothetical protein R3W88_028202 [Solanum pinnatisectum]